MGFTGTELLFRKLERLSEMRLHWQNWVTEGGPWNVLLILSSGSSPLRHGQPWGEYLLPHAPAMSNGDTSAAIPSVKHIYRQTAMRCLNSLNSGNWTAHTHTPCRVRPKHVSQSILRCPRIACLRNSVVGRERNSKTAQE